MPGIIEFEDKEGKKAQYKWELDRSPTQEEYDAIYNHLQSQGAFKKRVGGLTALGEYIGGKLAETTTGVEFKEKAPEWGVKETLKEIGGTLAETVAYGTPTGRAITFGVPLLAKGYGTALWGIPVTALGGAERGTQAIRGIEEAISEVPILGKPVSPIGEAVQYGFGKMFEATEKGFKKSLDYLPISEPAKETLSSAGAELFNFLAMALAGGYGKKVTSKIKEGAREKFEVYRDLSKVKFSLDPKSQEILDSIRKETDAVKKEAMVRDLQKKIDKDAIKLMVDRKQVKSLRERLNRLSEEEKTREVEIQPSAETILAKPIPEPTAPAEPITTTEPTITAPPPPQVPLINRLSDLNEIDRLIKEKYGEASSPEVMKAEVIEVKNAINQLKSQLPEDFRDRQKSYYRMYNGLKKKGVVEEEALKKATDKYGNIPEFEKVNAQIRELEDQLKETVKKKPEPIPEQPPTTEQIPSPKPSITEPLFPETTQVLEQARNPYVGAYELLKRGVPYERVIRVYPELKDVSQERIIRTAEEIRRAEQARPEATIIPATAYTPKERISEKELGGGIIEKPVVEKTRPIEKPPEPKTIETRPIEERPIETQPIERPAETKKVETPSTPEVTTTGKQPWEMTLQEFISTNPKWVSTKKTKSFQQWAREKGIEIPHYDIGKIVWESIRPFKTAREVGKLNSEIRKQKEYKKIYSEYLKDVPNAEKEIEANIIQARVLHKRAIRKAFKEGKPIPPEVLKDYPDFSNITKETPLTTPKEIPTTPQPAKPVQPETKAEPDTKPTPPPEQPVTETKGKVEAETTTFTTPTITIDDIIRDPSQADVVLSSPQSHPIDTVQKAKEVKANQKNPKQPKVTPEQVDKVMDEVTKERTIEPSQEPVAKKPLTVKEQKGYLLSEVDRLLKQAPEGEPTYKTDEVKGRIIDFEKTPTVTIKVPDDGEYTIANYKSTLTKFRNKVAREFPSREGEVKKEKEATLPKPSGKRIENEDVAYYNEYRPRKQKLVEGDYEDIKNEYGDVIDQVRRNMYTEDGYYTNGYYAVKMEKPKDIKTWEDDKVKSMSNVFPDKDQLQKGYAVGEFKDFDTKQSFAHIVGEDGSSYFVDPHMLDSVLTVYPNAEIKVAKNNMHKPVVLEVNGENVGAVMPIQNVEIPEQFKARAEQFVKQKLEQAEPPIEPAPVSVPSDFESFVELKGKTLSSLTPKERKAYAEEYNALKLGREEWAKEKQRAVEEAEKAPFNEPDILEKKITGKVTKPITATKRIKDILKDDRGSFSLKALKELDDVIENYKTKEKQPVSPEEYFGALGGYWGKVRKYTMHYITAMDKFGEKAEGVQHMIGRMDEDMGRLTKYYEELKPLFTANEKDVKTVLGKMMEWRKEEVKGIKTDAELSQLGWTPEQINLYKTVRHATRNHADDIRDVYLSRLEIEGYDIPRTVEESKRLLKTLKEDPNATPDMIDTAQLAYNINRLADTMKEMHYVPASRFGKYYVALINEKGVTEALHHFDKKKLADEKATEYWNKIESEGKKGWTVNSGKNVKPLLASTYQLTPSTMIFTKHVLEQMKKSGKLSGALEDIYHDLDRITAKWGNKFPTHLLKADMIPGWSEDYARSFASYIRGLSSFIAHVKYDPKIRYAIAKLDPIKDRELIDWMNKKYEFMNSSSTVTSVINRGLFMYYLAGNPKSAIVNTLQHLNSVAYSTKWLSPTEAMRTHVKASKYTYDYLMNKKESIPKDMLEVLEDMSRKERISAQAIQTLADISSGKGIRTNKVMEALSFGFKKAEEFNRAHATITAFEIGKKLGLKGEKMTAFIERFINDTQYDYTKLGVPLLAQHPAIRPLWAFRTFTYNWLRVMKNLLGEGHYGTFVAMLTPLFMLGGLTGLPLAPEMLSAIKSTTGFDFHTWLKEKEKQIGDENGTLSDSIMFGLGGLGGMSLGASLNPVELPNVGVRHTLEEAALQAGLGAPGSLYWRAKRAYQMLDRYGDTYRAVENMMPEFIRNLMVTYRWYKEKGARAASGEPYYENISVRDLIFRSFGIQPVKYIEGLEKMERMKELMESAKSDVAKVNLLIAKQVFRMMGGNENEQKDAEEKIQNIIENLMAKNAEYAEKGEYSKIIVPDERAIRMNVLKMANPDAYYLTMSPERARPEMAQMLDAWGSALNLGEEEVAEAINDEVETYGMRELLKLAGQSTEEE